MQKKAEKSLGNIKEAVKFDVNRNEENSSRLASVLLVRSVFERYSVKDDIFSVNLGVFESKNRKGFNS